VAQHARPQVGLAAAGTGAADAQGSDALLREALAVVRSVDAATIARDALARTGAAPGATRGDAVAAALRDARIDALREWRAGRRASA
jgi:hypothetical protein